MRQVILFIKKNYIYFFLFIYYFLCLQFVYSSYSLDSISNYGFSYAITKGEIPYNDFNLIIPLFGPFLYSLGLFINNSLLIMYLEQALLLTILSFLVFKMLGKTKGWILLFILMLPFPVPFVYIIYPGYNFLLIFLFILLIFLEKNNKSDKIIGIILGLSILTKQNIGILFLLCSIVYYHKDIKKVITRFLYALIPIFFFIIYLIFTKSFFNFINLCFLGMFDFSSSNSNYMFRYLFVSILCFIIVFVKFIKNKDISYLYLLMFFGFIYPILDFYHLVFLLFLCFYVLLLDCNICFNIKNINIIFMFLLSIFSLIYVYVVFSLVRNLKYYSFSHLPYQIVTDSYVEKIYKVNEYLKGKEVIYLIDNAIYFLIINDKKLTYYSLLNHGNYGLNGTDMMLLRLRNEKSKYILVDDLNSKQNSLIYNQFLFELVEYAQENMKLVKKIDNYSIYYKE